GNHGLLVPFRLPADTGRFPNSSIHQQPPDFSLTLHPSTFILSSLSTYRSSHLQSPTSRFIFIYNTFKSL
ncbi:hypothetical protein GBF38_008338, partial [Nibea albiflora]